VLVSFRIFIVIGLLFISSWALASERACVLYFERSEHPVSKELFNKLQVQKHKLKSFVIGSTPASLLKCLEIKATKILIIAHGGLTGENNDDYRLSFFLPKPELDYQKIKQQGLAELREHRKAMINKKKQQGCDFDDQYPCSLIHDEIKELDRKRSLVSENGLKLALGYDQNLVLRRSIDLFVQNFEKAPYALKEIMFFSCDGEQVIKGYPSLKKLKNHGVRMRSAKQSKFWSFIYGKSVLSLNVDEVLEEL
jgi:hypothetical protein